MTRAKTIRTWLFVIAYSALGFGGAWLFSRWVHDAGWRDMFYSAWWLPSGAAALWLTNSASDWITSWVSEGSSSSSS